MAVPRGVTLDGAPYTSTSTLDRLRAESDAVTAAEQAAAARLVWRRVPSYSGALEILRTLGIDPKDHPAP